MMESEVTGNCHASFGERDRETRKLQDLKVRSVPTLFSPLLANIALHGMSDALGITYNQKGKVIGDRAVVKYADDFVVFCRTKEDAESALMTLNQWLKNRGLELSESNPKIVHLTEGFNFLGFHVKLYRVSNTRTGWKLLIKPSKDSVLKIKKKLREKWISLKGYNLNTVIDTLNPIIRGEANYFRIGVSCETFSYLDHWMFTRECKYANHTHPNKNNSWRQEKYWGRLNLERKDNYVFGNKQTGKHLLKFSWFKISRPVLVKGKSSPDDPNLKEYWKNREKAKASEHTKSI